MLILLKSLKISIASGDLVSRGYMLAPLNNLLIFIYIIIIKYIYI